MNINTKGRREIKAVLRTLGVRRALTSPLMLWFGSALEFLPIKCVPNETIDLLGELHQLSSLLFQLLLSYH